MPVSQGTKNYAKALQDNLGGYGIRTEREESQEKVTLTGHKGPDSFIVRLRDDPDAGVAGLVALTADNAVVTYPNSEFGKGMERLIDLFGSPTKVQE